MGLVGFCWRRSAAQIIVDYLTPRDFARRPLLWLNDHRANQRTISYSPSFGYDLAARRGAARCRPISICPVAHCRHRRRHGAAGVLEPLPRRSSRRGFDRRAFLPSYGMAETTLPSPSASSARACASTSSTAPATRRRVPSRRPIARIRARPALRGLRPVLPGHRRRPRRGRPAADREVGRIFIRGPSLMPGYFDNPSAPRGAVHRRLARTGDLGYLLDGEIVITGRAKDLILLNGRNIWPQDIEWAVEARRRAQRRCRGLLRRHRRWRGVVVPVLARSSDEELDELGRHVAGRVREAAGIDCEVVLVAPSTLPLTSSGKLSRSRANANFLAGPSTRPEPPRPDVPAGGGHRGDRLRRARISLPPWPRHGWQAARCWSAAGRRCRRLAGVDAEIVWGDLVDEASLARLVAGADAVVHAAGLIKARRPRRLRRVNATARRRLSALAPERPVPPPVLAGGARAAAFALCRQQAGGGGGVPGGPAPGSRSARRRSTARATGRPWPLQDGRPRFRPSARSAGRAALADPCRGPGRGRWRSPSIGRSPPRSVESTMAGPMATAMARHGEAPRRGARPTVRVVRIAQADEGGRGH